MESFATLIGQYNATLLTLTDADYGHPAIDSKSRLILDHTTSSMKIGDGTLILSILKEDDPYAGGERGIGFLGVRKDAVGSLVSADGDFTFAQFDAQGRLRVDAEVSVSTGSDKAEDTPHATGHIGCFSLSIRIEDLADDNSALLAGTDGDYQGTFTNSKGEMYVHDKDLLDATNGTFGTNGDVGVDEDADGEVDSPFHATNFAVIETIAVGAGVTYYLKAWDMSTDHQAEMRLCVFDDAVLTKVIRKRVITENVGGDQILWPIPRVVVGALNRTIQFQARCMRTNKTSHVGGGINGYVD